VACLSVTDDDALATPENGRVHRLGLGRADVGCESIPYVAAWGEDGALNAIREYAERSTRSPAASRTPSISVFLALFGAFIE
jgi:hypothetical protein